MLSKKKRITKSLFQDIMKSGKSIHSPLFMFKYLIQKDPQYAFVVSKAVAKKATDRNRLRRQGYMALHSHRLKPVAGIFFFKKSLKKTSISDIKENISSVLNKINT